MNRFELESGITELYSIVDSLNDISYGIIESDLSRDEASDAIDGLAVITKMKLEKLFKTFTDTFNLDQNNDINDYPDCSDKTDPWSWF